MKHLAVIRFWYEGNAFSPLPASAELFRAREWVAGPAARDFYRGTEVEIAAVEPFTEANPGIEAHHVFCAAAYPAGPMVPGLFGQMRGRIEEGLAAREWDGVYLSLHGSSVAADVEHPELSLLESVRAIVGAIPLAVTLDLHANLAPALGQLADIVVGYKTYPHVDMRETGARALSLLGRTMAGEIRPQCRVRAAGFAPTSFNMRTAAGPMAEMMALARESEAAHGFYDLSVFGGFVYADAPHTGAAISLCAEKGHPAAPGEAVRLGRELRARAGDFDARLPQPAPVLRALGEEFAIDPGRAPVAILEPSDNVFSGGGADTPGLLRQVLEIGVGAPVLFAFFWDPDIAARAHRAGPGATFECAFGGRLSERFGAPVRASARVERLTDGRFVNRGPMEKGLAVDLGITAVMRVGEVSIIVTSRNVPVNDPAYFVLHGLDPADFAVTCVKAKNHFRAAFAAVFERIIEVETPGPASSNLMTFRFRHVPDSRLFPATPVRDAGPEDAAEVAALHVTSWRTVYADILPAAYLESGIETERYRFWTRKLDELAPGELLLLTRSGGALTGFVWVTRAGEPGYDAVIEALHVHPRLRGGGIGKRLLAGAVRRLLADGAGSACLRVYDANTAAIEFYTRLGGVADAHGIDGFAGADAPDTRIGWRDLERLLSLCGDA